MFKRLLLAACLALPLAAQSADGKKPASQQEKMATCNKEAAAKKLQGEERSKFMSSCLSAASTSARRSCPTA